MRVPVVRNSTRAAEYTAVLRELDHISFQRQNWFGGIMAAKAAAVSPQLRKIGRTASSNGGTKGTSMKY